jgi:ComF family protein
MGAPGTDEAGLVRIWSDLRRWALLNLRNGADLILPPICVHCHTPNSEHGILCPACWQGIDFITPPLCDRSGAPMAYGGGDERLISAAALRDPPIFGRARAAARFDGVIRNLVHGFKYADRHEVSGLFARMMRSAGGALIREADLLIPVPLHPHKLWKRRYNQAAILAWKLSALTGLPVDAFSLRRVRRTPSPVGLSSEERRANVAAAFAVAPHAAKTIQGKRILLIDDVMTTGSTLSACTRVLKDAGAVQVDCLAVAMAVGGDDGNTR